MSITEQQIKRIVYSGWDFQQALSALTFLLEDCDHDEKYSKVQLRRFRCYENTVIMSLTRPFVKSRGASVLGLRAIGITLNEEEEALLNKAKLFRNKVVAHSDEDLMHYRIDTFKMLEETIIMPHSQFDEGLAFNRKDLHEIEDLLLKLMNAIFTYIFDLAQNDPSLLNHEVTPKEYE